MLDSIEEAVKREEPQSLQKLVTHGDSTKQPNGQYLGVKSEFGQIQYLGTGVDKAFLYEYCMSTMRKAFRFTHSEYSGCPARTAMQCPGYMDLGILSLEPWYQLGV